MIQIDTTDFLYKTLKNLGVKEEIENQYLVFAQNGITNIKDFNNYLQACLGLDYVGEFDENLFEEVADYYKDLKINKMPAKNKTKSMLARYLTNPTNELKQDIINSQLKETLLIACAYKINHPNINLSDLVQICNLGLMTAVDNYREVKLPFEIYLNYWILDTINKEFTLGEEKNG